MRLCTTCHRELKVGQRVQPNYKLIEIVVGEGVRHKLSDIEYQHSNCYEAEGPLYNTEGVAIY